MYNGDCSWDEEISKVAGWPSARRLLVTLPTIFTWTRQLRPLQDVRREIQFKELRPSVVTSVL